MFGYTGLKEGGTGLKEGKEGKEGKGDEKAVVIIILCLFLFFLVIFNFSNSLLYVVEILVCCRVACKILHSDKGHLVFLMYVFMDV